MPAFALVMTALLGGVTVYFACRTAQCVQYVFPRFPFAASLAVFVLLTAVLVLGFMRSMLPIGAGVKNVLRLASAYWMGACVYLLLFLLAGDAVLLLGRLLRLIPKPMPQSCRFAAIAASLACALAVTLYGFCHAADVRVKTYDVALAKLQQDMNVVLVSDLHLGAVGSENRLEKVVEQINALSPQMVCIAGDVFDNDFSAVENPDRIRMLLSSLDAPYGVYACLGNHDAGSTYGQMVDFLAQCQITLLAEECTVIDDRLVLVGRADASPIGRGGVRRADLQTILQNASPELPVVVMDHNPAHVHTYGAETQLVLSGHTHRGQILPGGLITKRMYAVDYGCGKVGDVQVIVTSGAGTWGMPMRIGTDCEVVFIRLVKQP